MRTWVNHEVMFQLDDGEGVILPCEGGYARLDHVTVHLHQDRPPRVSSGGRRCKKNGDPDGRLRGGNWIVMLTLPDADKAEWIARAEEAIIRDAEAVNV